MFGFLPSIGPWELILILIIALVIFGPGKLPEVGKALGKGLREFRSAANQVSEQINEATREVQPEKKDKEA